MKREDATWLAAMVDGEGSISVFRKDDKRHIFPVMRVYNTFKAIPTKCKEITREGRITQRTNKGLKRANYTSWYWTVQSQKAINIIKDIYPYLIIKREQAKVAIELQKLNIYKGQEVPLEVLKKKEELRQLCKNLNLRREPNGDLKERVIKFSGLPEPILETK